MKTISEALTLRRQLPQLGLEALAKLARCKIGHLSFHPDGSAVRFDGDDRFFILGQYRQGMSDIDRELDRVLPLSWSKPGPLPGVQHCFNDHGQQVFKLPDNWWIVSV